MKPNEKPFDLAQLSSILFFVDIADIFLHFFS